jgi:hypothetical protein
MTEDEWKEEQEKLKQKAATEEKASERSAVKDNIQTSARSDDSV